MKIKPKKITVGDLEKDYRDDGEGGVTGYGGKLDIRPPYQREFVYKAEQRNAVIHTVQQGFPLNVMYWSDKGDGTFEIIDGQQRTISICQYLNGDFSIDGLAYHNLQSDQKERILNYELRVYVCSGTDSERLKWFETINIAGMVLKKQELRNAVYHGPWVSSAKVYFSRPICPAHDIGSNYMKGSHIRQEYLETAIKWINDGDVEGYMSKNQHGSDANELWLYYKSVINWVETVFPNHREEMKGIEWGMFFNQYKEEKFSPEKLEKQIQKLIIDDEVTNKKGIYEFLITGDERALNLRAFSKEQKLQQYEIQQGICPECGKKFPIKEMEADHITPWSKGGKTDMDNCQMLCREHNRQKSNK